MKKLTQSEIIVKHLDRHAGEWIPSHNLMKVATDFGWIGSEGKRRARELAEAGKIKVRTEGKYAEYTSLLTEPPKVRQLVPVYGEDGRVLSMKEILV